MNDTTENDLEGQSGRSWIEGPAPWLAVSVGILLALLANAFRHPQFINYDCAALLYEGQLLLEGKVPYVDFIEINPPLIIYINALPAAMARVLNIGLPLAFNLFVLTLVVASVLVVWRTLRLMPGWADIERGFIVMIWVAISALIYLIYEFGQREHLFLLVIVPYAMLRLARLEGANVGFWHAGPIGLATGIGCSLKPHFFLAVFAIEILTFWRRRSLKHLLAAEHWLMAAFITIYVVHWWFVPDAMREGYLNHLVPLLVRKYGAFSSGLYGMLVAFINPDYGGIFFFLGMGLLLWVGFRLRHEMFPFIGTFAGLYCAGFCIFLFQWKIWHYHYLPAISFQLIALAGVFLQARRFLLRDREYRTAVAGLQWLALAIGGVFLVLAALFCLARAPDRNRGSLYDFVVAHSRTGDPILVVSTSAPNVYPMLVQTQRRLASRYLLAFPLPLAYFDGKNHQGPPYHTAELMEPIESEYLRNQGEDIAKYRPEVIMIPSSPGGAGLAGNFNIHDYFTQQGWIERYMGDYREIPGPSGYRSYVRKPEARPPNSSGSGQ